MPDANSTPLLQQKYRSYDQYSDNPRVMKMSLKHWSFALPLASFHLIIFSISPLFPFKKQLTLTNYYHSKRYVITLRLIWLPLAVEKVDDMRQASVSQQTDDDSWILCQCLYTCPRCPRSWPQLNTDPLWKLQQWLVFWLYTCTQQMTKGAMSSLLLFAEWLICKKSWTELEITNLMHRLV